MVFSFEKMPTYTGEFLLVLWAAIAALGYGSLLSRLLRINPNLGDRGILGLLTFAFLGCLFNFFTPVSSDTHVAILMVGVLLTAIHFAELRNSKIVWAVAALTLAYVFSRPQFKLSYDTGLYHLQTLQWIKTQPIVPGLANLHSRLAVNSAIFLIAAVADEDGIGWVSNILVVLFVLLSIFLRLRNVIARKASGVEFWILLISFLGFIEARYLPNWYGVMNGDLFTAVLIIYWTCVAVGSSDSALLSTDLAMAVLSAILATIVKTSALPLLLPAFALAWLYRKRLSVEAGKRSAIFGGLVLGLWMLRGIVLSGCALYPAQATCITSLPWAESGQRVAGMSRAIRSWARHPGEGDFAKVLKDNAWIPIWLSTARDDRYLRLLIILAPLGLISALIQRYLLGRPADVPILAVAAGLTACLLFWFLSAPDTRFGQGFILAAAFLGGAITLAACFHQPRFAALFPRCSRPLWVSMS